MEGGNNPFTMYCSFLTVVVRFCLQAIVTGQYSLADYVQAVLAAGAFATSNGNSGGHPGISFEQAATTAALPTDHG